MHETPRWPQNFRDFTLCVAFTFGGWFILITLLNYTTNPEPQPDVCFAIAKTVAYLVLVALPNRWVMHSWSRFLFTFFLLCIPAGMGLFSLALEIGVRHVAAAHPWLYYFLGLPLSVTGILFYSIGPLSLYLNWRYGWKAA
jgi:hypothetical protein